MVRTLFFVDAPHRVGGAQRSLFNALRRMPAHGISPLAVFPGEGTCVQMYRDAGIDTRVIQAPAPLLEFGKKHMFLDLVARARLFVRDVAPYARPLLSLARAEGIEVWHFNTPRGILVAGLAAKRARLPTVLHLRGIIPFDWVYWGVAQSLADRIMLVARSLETTVWPLFRRRTRVVHDGVAPPAPRDRRLARAALAELVRIAPATLDDETVFVSLSSPVPFKGLHHLVEAAARLRDRGIRTRWVLAGTPEGERYVEFLLRRVEAQGLSDRVHLLGYVKDPGALLAASDALVLPSVESERLDMDDGLPAVEVRGNEGFPLSILEAFSEGLPVVASRVAGVPEQVDDGRTGYIVPPGDVRALAAALERVAGDRVWRRAAGELARRAVAERFTLDGVVSRMAAVLHDAAGSGGHTAFRQEHRSVAPRRGRDG